MISALVALTSLNLTLALIQDYGVVAKTWTITAATTTTPIVVTSVAHGVPLGRVVHGIVSGVAGEVEANGLWILTPLDADTFALSALTAQGLPVQSVGVNAYTGGGQIQTALVDYSILLGRRNVALAVGAASPRVVFVPTAGRAWGFEPYGGAAPSVTSLPFAPTARGSVEQQSMTVAPQLATEFPTFEVWIHGCAPDFGAAAPAPDGGDFDAAQSLAFVLFGVLFDETGGLPRARVLREDWPSQRLDSGTMTQRGQTWMGVIEFQQPVTKPPLTFAPIGVSGQFTVEPVNPASGDPVVITIT
jgi:hypothetical protein